MLFALSVVKIFVFTSVSDSSRIMMQAQNRDIRRNLPQGQQGRHGHSLKAEDPNRQLQDLSLRTPERLCMHRVPAEEGRIVKVCGWQNQLRIDDCLDKALPACFSSHIIYLNRESVSFL